MLNDILATILHSTVSVVIFFILTRIMGKKQLSQLTFFDYVVGISIGSIAAAFDPKDMNIQATYKGLCLNIIIDGEILDDHLQMLSKDRK